MSKVVTTIIITMTGGTTLSRRGAPGTICRGIAIQKKSGTRVKVKIKARDGNRDKIEIKT
jgi:archaellum component FlaG (FlaF/FlaG flagellin family)